MVGGLLVRRRRPSCAAGVIFFNNVGYLGMCGHGTIGLVVTLAHLGRIGPASTGSKRPSGVVTVRAARLGRRHGARTWRAIRHASKASRRTSRGSGVVTGDVAWGGNWFFLVHDHGQDADVSKNIERLTDVRWRIRRRWCAGRHRRGWAEIDHIELFGPPTDAGRQPQELRALPRQGLRPLALRHRHERQARLPGRRRQTRRGRGLAAGEHDRQHVRGDGRGGGRRGLSRASPASAFITAEATLVLDERDPFCMGIPAPQVTQWDVVGRGDRRRGSWARRARGVRREPWPAYRGGGAERNRRRARRRGWAMLW